MQNKRRLQNNKNSKIPTMWTRDIHELDYIINILKYKKIKKDIDRIIKDLIH